MIAADHDRGFQLALCDHFIEGQAQLVAFAQADPADARRQALELDALPRHVEPAVQVRIVRDEFLHLGVGLVDVFRIAGQGGPAEGTDAAAEERADIGRHETGKSKALSTPMSWAIWRILFP